MDTPPPEATKEQWRSWARGLRAEIDFEALSEAVTTTLQGWSDLAAASKVLAFLPLADEIDLRMLFESMPDCEFLATRTPDRGGRLSVHGLGGPLEVHPLGFLQPHRTAPEIRPEELDVLLLPGLAFDLWGTRLGRGAGYFDELLSRTRPDAVAVGVTPAALVVDRLPAEPHDVAVSRLATEEGVIPVAEHG